MVWRRCSGLWSKIDASLLVRKSVAGRRSCQGNLRTHTGIPVTRSPRGMSADPWNSLMNPSLRNGTGGLLVRDEPHRPLRVLTGFTDSIGLKWHCSSKRCSLLLCKMKKKMEKKSTKNVVRDWKISWGLGHHLPVKSLENGSNFTLTRVKASPPPTWHLCCLSIGPDLPPPPKRKRLPRAATFKETNICCSFIFQVPHYSFTAKWKS